MLAKLWKRLGDLPLGPRGLLFLFVLFAVIEDTRDAFRRLIDAVTLRKVRVE